MQSVNNNISDSDVMRLTSRLLDETLGLDQELFNKRPTPWQDISGMVDAVSKLPRSMSIAVAKQIRDLGDRFYAKRPALPAHSLCQLARGFALPMVQHENGLSIVSFTLTDNEGDLSDQEYLGLGVAIVEAQARMLKPQLDIVEKIVARAARAQGSAAVRELLHRKVALLCCHGDILTRIAHTARSVRTRCPLLKIVVTLPEIFWQRFCIAQLQLSLLKP